MKVEIKNYDSSFLYGKANYGKTLYEYIIKAERIDKDSEAFEDIKYIVPHQSNLKIIKAIASRLKIEEEKMYINLQNKGNTFCASIPITLEEMKEKGYLKEKDKIILLGYGGGLNTGSILLEI